jgi:hypothetical protein
VNGLPVGVMLAAKREGVANWIHSVGLHPDHQRTEHGKHMMTSLSAKLAILKPTRMLLEVPADATVARQFVEACGYHEETMFTDFTRPATPGQGGMLEIIIPTTVEELVENEAFDREARRCWARAPETLLNLSERLDGLAISSGESIEAYVLFDDETDLEHRQIMAFHANSTDPARAERMLALLLEACASTTDRPLHVSRASPKEQALAGLQKLGFVPSVQTVGYAAEAQSA